MPSHLVFDVNETLLDMTTLDEFIEGLSGEAGLAPLWFSLLKESWMVATLVDHYRPFGELARSALAALGSLRDFAVTEADQVNLVDRLTHLPAHPEVAATLARLANEGHLLTAFSNGTEDALATQLEASGLREHFHHVFSVDAIQCYKPAPRAYRYVASELGIDSSAMIMIAAHGWDVTGAAHAGCRTAFVARPGKVLSPADAAPDWIGENLDAVADRLLADLD